MALVVLMNLMAPMALVNQAGLVAHMALVALNHQIHQIQIGQMQNLHSLLGQIS